MGSAPVDLTDLCMSYMDMVKSGAPMSAVQQTVDVKTVQSDSDLKSILGAITTTTAQSGCPVHVSIGAVGQGSTYTYAPVQIIHKTEENKLKPKELIST